MNNSRGLLIAMVVVFCMSAHGNSSAIAISDSVSTSSEGVVKKKKSKGQTSDVLLWGFAGGLFGGYAAAEFTHEEEDTEGLAAFENIDQFILGFTVGFFVGAISYLIVQDIKSNNSPKTLTVQRNFPMDIDWRNDRIFGRFNGRLYITYRLKF